MIAYVDGSTLSSSESQALGLDSLHPRMFHHLVPTARRRDWSRLRQIARLRIVFDERRPFLFEAQRRDEGVPGCGADTLFTMSNPNIVS
ncbi:hypothetical protein [Paracoccus marcusii]|uniref:hypothetical protein n=1 Tax=Paracoccus marcusii TaxID=59779 RepID=UPI002490883C|nr:hypothetical protein [Paracoccus marcusii]